MEKALEKVAEKIVEKEINAVCREVRESDLEMIMEWRMRPDITRYMNSDPMLTLEGQQKWFEKIKNSKTDFYWVIEVDGMPAGLISLVEYDDKTKTIHTGAYIAIKEKRSIKLAIYLQWNLYEYAFEKLGVEKVQEEVFTANFAVARILKMCGSKEEGIIRNQVFKNGEYYDVMVRGILKEEWKILKPQLKYDKFDFMEEKEL